MRRGVPRAKSAPYRSVAKKHPRTKSNTGGATYSLKTAFAHGGPWHLRARPSSAPPIARVHGGQCGTHTRPTPTARIHRSEEWRVRRVLEVLQPPYERLHGAAGSPACQCLLSAPRACRDRLAWSWSVTVALSRPSASHATTWTHQQVHQARLRLVHRHLVTGRPDPRNARSDLMLPRPFCRCAGSIDLMQRDERFSGLWSSDAITAASLPRRVSCNTARIAYRVRIIISACQLRPAFSVCGMRTKHWLRAKCAEVISRLCGHLSAYGRGSVPRERVWAVCAGQASKFACP